MSQYTRSWSGRGDLNSRPPAPKAGALPGCATPRHEVRKDYKGLPNGTVAPSDQFRLHGVNPKTETVLTRTLCREAPANGNPTSLATSERIQADGRRAFNNCENIVALAKELGIQRRLLYKWRKNFEVADAIGEPVPPNAREGRLRKELGHVKRLLAEKALEADFFRSALQRVEARRQQSSVAGEKTSTTTSVA
jgi:transposase-like protein